MDFLKSIDVSYTEFEYKIVQVSVSKRKHCNRDSETISKCLPPYDNAANIFSCCIVLV